MLKFPTDISKARILIANDDSIHSEGIKVLEDIARQITPHVYVVAPETQQSAVGHSLTIHMPLRMKKYDDTHYSVYGTPTDSVLIGVRKVMKEARPDLILSGINHGQNTADDVTYSGTIAAAIEGTLMGIPSLAISQDVDEDGSSPVDWAIARDQVPRVLQHMQGVAWDKNVVISVNMPQAVSGVTPEIRVLPQGHFTMEKQEMIEATDPRGRPYFWVGAPPERDVDDQAFDVGSLRAGHVTITPLSLNLTHHKTLESLQKVFK